MTYSPRPCSMAQKTHLKLYQPCSNLWVGVVKFSHVTAITAGLIIACFLCSYTDEWGGVWILYKVQNVSLVQVVALSQVIQQWCGDDRLLILYLLVCVCVHACALACVWKRQWTLCHISKAFWCLRLILIPVPLTQNYGFTL